MESIQTDSTIEIAIVETPYVQIQNPKFPTRKKYRFPEFNLDIDFEQLIQVFSKILFVSHTDRPNLSQDMDFFSNFALWRRWWPF